jgi:hypothetical protein
VWLGFVLRWSARRFELGLCVVVRKSPPGSGSSDDLRY